MKDSGCTIERHKPDSRYPVQDDRIQRNSKCVDRRRDDDSVRRDRDWERERDEDERRKVGIARLRTMAEGTGKGIIVGM